MLCLKYMIDSAKGENLPEGYMSETFLFLWNDENKYYVRIHKSDLNETEDAK